MMRFFSSSNFSALDVDVSPELGPDPEPFRGSVPRRASFVGGGRGRSRPFMIVSLLRRGSPDSFVGFARSRRHGRDAGVSLPVVLRAHGA